MTTPLTKPLKRELLIQGRPFVVTRSPEGIKLTLKGKRKGQELLWTDLVSGEAALAVALNASLKGLPEPGDRSSAGAVQKSAGTSAGTAQRSADTSAESATEARGSAGSRPASSQSAASTEPVEDAANTSNSRRRTRPKKRAASRPSNVRA